MKNVGIIANIFFLIYLKFNPSLRKIVYINHHIS
jgi:hypothetical protein